MPPVNIPGRPVRLDPNDRGFYVDDPGGPTDGLYFGTDGNVSLFDTAVEGAGDYAEDSPLEALLAMLAEEAGVSTAEFGDFLGKLGVLTPVVGVGAGRRDFVSGKIELDNARVDVGDIVHLGDGDDRMFARGGNDIVFGGEGNDDLHGQGGKDLLFGGDGDDVLRGGDGADLLSGGDGADRLIAGGGGDNELLYLGTDTDPEVGPDHPALNRDDHTDIVLAEASFADNGTDRVYQYSDGQGGAIARDVIDLSDTFDFSADADTAAEREAELLDMFHVVAVPLAGAPSRDVSGAHIRDLGADGEIGGGDDNTWFMLNEGDPIDPTKALSVPEVVTVTVDGFTFEWDIQGAATSWVEIA